MCGSHANHSPAAVAVSSPVVPQIPGSAGSRTHQPLNDRPDESGISPVTPDLLRSLLRSLSLSR